MNSSRALRSRALWLVGTLFLTELATADPGLESSPCEAAEQCLELRVGEQKVLSAEGVRSFSEGKRGIVDVRLTKDGKKFVLVGLGGGTTSILLLLDDGGERQIKVHVPEEAREVGSRSGGIERKENIRLDFFFVELDRATGHQLGLGPAGSLSGPQFSAEFDFLSQSFQSATAVVEEQALVRLDLAEARGFAKLARRAAVITENGAKASLRGGGEVNLPVQGSLSTGIYPISYGSEIVVEPSFDPVTGRLEISLTAEVSDLTEDRGTGAPGRMTSSITTTVNLELGEAVVLAGLTSSNETMTRAGVPLLSQLPILGFLFGSERVTKRVTDHVVFIIPSVIDSVSTEVKSEIEAAFSTYREYSGQREGQQRMRSTWGAK